MRISEGKLKKIITETINNFFKTYINENNGTIPNKNYNIGEIITLNNDEFIKLSPSIWTILEESYENIGGIKTYKNFNDFCKKKPYVEVIVVNNEILACATYRRVEGSFKMVSIGCNQTPEGKIALQQIIINNINRNDLHYWAEVSGAIEYYFKKHNGYPIPNTIASEVLQIDPSQIILSKTDDVHYDRPIGPQGEMFTKMIYGFKNEEIYKKAIAEVENYSKIMFEVNKINESSTKYSIKQAIYIIENIYRAHEEDGFNELIPSWYEALLESIKTLKTCGKTDDTINDYIEYGEYLLSDMQILEVKRLVV